MAHMLALVSDENEKKEVTLM